MSLTRRTFHPVTVTETLAEWIEAVRIEDVPGDVVDMAATQLLGLLGALHAGAAHDLGRRVLAAFPGADEPGASLLLPTAEAASPKRAAYVHAALTMTLDFDDTAFAGHVSHSTVNVPLAYALPCGLSGADLVLAQVAANEVAARVTAAATLGPHRGQTAVHTHLVGAAAARGKAEALAAPLLVDAFGIALAQPGWVLYRAFMGSDAKVFTASVPIRTSLDAVDAARAGLRGAPEIVEAHDGFLARFSDVAVPDWADGLGERWHTRTLSFKRYPGCAYIDTAVDCALDVAAAHGPDPAEIEEVDVWGSLFTVGMDAHSAAYRHGPGTAVSALNFSVPYNVAVALRHGRLQPEDFDAAAREDPDTWALAGRVRLHYDPALDEAALFGTAPVGAALRRAGERALDFVAAALGAAGDTERTGELRAALTADGDEDFSRPTKSVGARVVVRMRDGRTFEAERLVPVGAAGESTPEEMRALMRDKFVTQASRTVGAARAEEAAGLLERVVELSPAELARALRLNTTP